MRDDDNDGYNDKRKLDWQVEGELLIFDVRDHSSPCHLVTMFGERDALKPGLVNTDLLFASLTYRYLHHLNKARARHNARVHKQRHKTYDST